MQQDDITQILVAIARLETRMSNLETVVATLAKRVECEQGHSTDRTWQVLVALATFLAAGGWGLLVYTITRTP